MYLLYLYNKIFHKNTNYKTKRDNSVIICCFRFVFRIVLALPSACATDNVVAFWIATDKRVNALGAFAHPAVLDVGLFKVKAVRTHPHFSSFPFKWCSMAYSIALSSAFSYDVK